MATGTVVPSSADFAAAGLSVRNQISQYAFPLLVIFVPSFCSTCAIAGATSDGGAPAGSALYWAKTATEESNNPDTARTAATLFILPCYIAWCVCTANQARRALTFIRARYDDYRSKGSKA